jgi:hypothetical protein
MQGGVIGKLLNRHLQVGEGSKRFAFGKVAASQCAVAVWGRTADKFPFKRLPGCPKLKLCLIIAFTTPVDSCRFGSRQVSKASVEGQPGTRGYLPEHCFSLGANVLIAPRDKAATAEKPNDQASQNGPALVQLESDRHSLRLEAG